MDEVTDGRIDVARKEWIKKKMADGRKKQNLKENY